MIESVIFDWKRTLYSPDDRELITGANELLSKLGEASIKLYLVGKDKTGDMPEEVERLGVAHYFDEIHFVRDGKSDDDIGRYIDRNHPEKSVVVGDRVRSEIEVGNRLGAITIQVKQGIFADELPETDIQKPNLIVEALQEVYGRIVDEVGTPDH